MHQVDALEYEILKNVFRGAMPLDPREESNPSHLFQP